MSWYTGADTGTVHSVDVRVTHGLIRDLKFDTLFTRLIELQSFVALGYFMATEPMQSRPDPKRPAGPSFEYNWMAEANRLTFIKAVSYQSPFEVWLSLLGGVSMALPVAHGLLGLHDRFQQARLMRSDVDLQTTVNEVIREEVAERRRGGEVELEVDPKLHRVAQNAGAALEHITGLEIDPKHRA